MLNKRVLPNAYLDLGEKSTPIECMRRCRTEGEGFAYAGVQFGRECFCGNDPPSPDKIMDKSQCDMKCSGDQDLICGGSLRMNVYHTGKDFFFFKFLDAFQKIGKRNRQKNYYLKIPSRNIRDPGILQSSVPSRIEIPENAEA